MSTVLDVAVCLLLVGVAVTTLAAAVPDEIEENAVDGDPTARSLGTVTATAPTGDEQRGHGTLAEHLARATVTSATFEGERVTRSPYPAAVRGEVESHVDARSRVTARWTPYPDAPLESRLSVGASPPRTADVAATELTVDSGVSEPESERSFRSLADSLATAYVERMFPPRRTRVGLLDPRTAGDVATRYRDAARALGVNLDGPIEDASPGRANEALSAALADRLETDLRTRYDSSGEAAADATPGEVVIVVRRWEP